jgi:hypothetical protein
MMDFGTPYRLVVESGAEPHVYNGSCRLIGILCASVGLTGLPVDPPPPEPPEPEGEPTPPEITFVFPESGSEGAEVVIGGQKFLPQGPNSTVTVGGEIQPIVAWNGSEITFLATQGASLPGFPLPVIVTTEAGLTSPVDPAPSFTFAAAREAGKASKGENKKHRKADDKKERGNGVRADQHTLPDFASGGGVMLSSADGAKIAVGPFGVEAGKFYPIGLEFRSGLKVDTSGALDITLVLAGPL